MSQTNSFKFRSTLALIAAATTLAAASPSFADSAVFGSLGGNIGDCTPSCTPQFQTVYDNTLFGTDPVSITGISYFLGSYDGDNSQTYTIRLSTSANQVGSLSSVFSDNVGADVATFYSGVPVVAGGAGGIFTFTGTPFAYNPNAGDLLVDIFHADSDFYVQSSYEGYNIGPANRQRVYSFSSAGTGSVDQPGYAISTEFTFSTGVVPEPATWAMMIIGFGAAGSMIRRQKAVVA